MTIAPLLASAILVAQSTPDATVRPYGFVSSTISVHPGTGEIYHRIDDRLNGTTWTIGGGAGVFLTPRLGLEGEFVYGGKVSAPQVFRYQFSEEYTVSNRDILINELVRYRAGGSAAVHLVGGGGFQRTTTQQTSQTFIDSFGRRSTLPDGPKQSYNGFTLTGGIDAVFAVGVHAAIGPTFRVRWLHRPRGGAQGWNGIGPFTFQAGATVILR